MSEKKPDHWFADLWREMFGLRAEVREEVVNGKGDTIRVIYVETPPRPHKPGAVYFVQASHAKAIKIGFSTRVEDRIKGLRTGTHARLKPLGHVPGNREDERALHTRFAKDRIRGEWFRATPGLLAFIREVLNRGALPVAEVAP
jgi:hypothetical protein